MIELTEAEVRAMEKELHDRPTEYDDSPWTDEEMELLAWEAGKSAGWEEMDDYDHLKFS